MSDFAGARSVHHITLLQVVAGIISIDLFLSGRDLVLITFFERALIINTLLHTEYLEVISFTKKQQWPSTY